MLLKAPIQNDIIHQLFTLDSESMKYSWSENQWSDFLQNKSAKVIFNKNPLGAILFNLEEHDDIVHLLKIMVDPQHQSRGIGKTMLRELVVFAQQSSKASIFLEVELTNENAVKFYLSQGFKQLRVIKKYYSDGSDALSMSLNLDEIAF